MKFFKIIAKFNMRLGIALWIGVRSFYNAFKVAWRLQPQPGDSLNIDFKWEIK